MPPPLPSSTPTPPHTGPDKRLKHIVIIIQENRSMDNLFNGFCLPHGPCADTVNVDPVTGTHLSPVSMAAPYSPYHEHGQFVIEYDYGKMDGFSKEPNVCHAGDPHCAQYTAFAYVPPHETAIYRQLATVDGVLADETFETDSGPSFPAHLYAIAGQSGGNDADRLALDDGQGTCSQHLRVTPQILMSTPFPGRGGPPGEPCKNFQTIFDLLEHAGHTWSYYTSEPTIGLRSPTQAIKHLYGSPHLIVPSTQFQIDVAGGKLADVTYVMSPSAASSDHPLSTTDPTAGPTWVASVVNAIGATPFWNDTAIVLWWDDWGGWFDHVRPPKSPVDPDPFEYGFRVPLIVVSPYARVGTIDHTTRTFVGALCLIEETFHLPSLHATDQYEPDGLDAAFDFDQAPIPFTPLGGSQAQPFR